MDRKFDLLQRMLDFGGLEEECIPSQTVIEFLGEHRALIENHQRVIEYDLNKVCVRTSFGVIMILGSNLQLRALTGCKLIITGRIDRMDICRGNGI